MSCQDQANGGFSVWMLMEGDARKLGTLSNAIDLVRKRKTEVLSGKKLPEKIRTRVVRFEELAKDAENYCKANNQGQQFDLYRIGRLNEEFGNQPAAIPIGDLRKWFGEQEWENATHNRYKTTISLIHRLGQRTAKCNQIPRSWSSTRRKTTSACVS